ADVIPLRPDAPRGAGGRRAAQPQAAAARRLRAAARRRHLQPAPARLPGGPQGRSDHPRGDGRDRRPGAADASGPPGRALEGDRPLPGRRPRADPLPGSGRAGHGPRDDPRGGRHRPGPLRDQLLPPAPPDRLPPPDEVARRAARPGRADPGPRVHDEGLVQPRPRRGRARHRLPDPLARLRAHLPPLWGRVPRGRRRHRDDGRHGLPRVHGALPGRRGHHPPQPLRRLRRQPRGRHLPPRRAAGRGPPPGRGGRDAQRHHDPGARRLPRRSPGADGEGGLLQGRLRPPRLRGGARRPRRQRDQAAEGVRRAEPDAGDRRGDPSRRRGAGVRLAGGRLRRLRGRRRERPRQPEPRRGGQPPGLPPQAHQPRSRLAGGHGRGHRQRRGRVPLADRRRAADRRAGDRGRQHLQVGDPLQRRPRGHLPRRRGSVPPDRDGLLRHRRRPPGRHRRRAAPRRQGHPLAGHPRALPRLPALARQGGRCGDGRRGRPPLRGADSGRRRGPLRRPCGPSGGEVRRRGADRLPDPPLGLVPHAGQGRGRAASARRRGVDLRPARRGRADRPAAPGRAGRAALRRPGVL
ncbi:MAG: Prolyl-tRNA synthetase, bacterial type, partial [uncultured Thermomicrobiales bacterium]